MWFVQKDNEGVDGNKQRDTSKRQTNVFKNLYNEQKFLISPNVPKKFRSWVRDCFIRNRDPGNEIMSNNENVEIDPETVCQHSAWSSCLAVRSRPNATLRK